MTVQLSVAVRNATLDAIETAIGASPVMTIRSGLPLGDCSTANTGTVLATIALPADWMNAASAGSKTLLGTWTDTLADNSGIAGHFRIHQGSTCHMQGTISMPGGGGDMIMDNTNLAVNQEVAVSVFTINAAGA